MKARTFALGLLISLGMSSQTLTAQSLFQDNPGLELPERTFDALGGRAFAKQLAGMPAAIRESEIVQQALAGNVPYFLRELRPVTLYFGDQSDIRQLTFWTTPDYFAIGNEHDYVRMPMNLYSASQLASQLNCILPTAKMVDMIYRKARHQLQPHPMRPGQEMTSMNYYQRHNRYIEGQLQSRDFMAGDLVAGHKKDVVISRKLDYKPQAIAIYGWHQSNGKVIQPLSTVHGAAYADYSHGIRLIHQSVEIINRAGEVKKINISEILRHPDFASLLSYEGPMDKQHKAFHPPRRNEPAGMQI